MNIKDYNGQTLHNVTVSLKLDGVCCIKRGSFWCSRENKPLYNLPDDMPDGYYECFCGSWEESVSAVRTQNGTPVTKLQLFAINPPEKSLVLDRYDVATPELLNQHFQDVIADGEEGLVYHADEGIFKHKGVSTIDLVVIGWQPGKGRNFRRMGALITEKGKVGSGFTDTERERFTLEFILDKVIEVEYARLTEDGLLWHPRFKRLREDK